MALSVRPITHLQNQRPVDATKPKMRIWELEAKLVVGQPSAQLSRFKLAKQAGPTMLANELAKGTDQLTGTGLDDLQLQEHGFNPKSVQKTFFLCPVNNNSFVLLAPLQLPFQSTICI